MPPSKTSTGRRTPTVSPYFSRSKKADTRTQAGKKNKAHSFHEPEDLDTVASDAPVANKRRTKREGNEIAPDIPAPSRVTGRNKRKTSPSGQVSKYFASTKRPRSDQFEKRKECYVVVGSVVKISTEVLPGVGDGLTAATDARITRNGNKAETREGDVKNDGEKARTKRRKQVTDSNETKSEPEIVDNERGDVMDGQESEKKSTQGRERKCELLPRAKSSRKLRKKTRNVNLKAGKELFPEVAVDEVSSLPMPEPWVPPFKPLASPYGLIQETLYDDPWRVLVASIFLNKTTAKAAIPVLWTFFEKYPTPHACAQGEQKDIACMLYPLGLYNRRAFYLKHMSVDYLLNPKFTSPSKELYGIGEYGEDSWRLFCRGGLEEEEFEEGGELLKLESSGDGGGGWVDNVWKRLNPKDKELAKYVQWRRKQSSLF